MKEHPLLCKAPVVRAILDGRQTQDRRPVKSRIAAILDEIERVNGKVALACMDFDVPTPWAVGDRLWVREHCFVTRADEDGAPLTEPPVVYAADGATKSDWYPFSRPSIHMPRWACRITLEVTGVRVERVQDITEEDIIKEGIEDMGSGCGAVSTARGKSYSTLRACFESLWCYAYGPGAWERNDFVWVTEFRRITP